MPYHANGGGPPATGPLTTGSKATSYSKMSKAPIFEKIKSVSYHETISDQIFAISSSPLATSSEAMPKAIEIQNNGPVPIFLMVGYGSYTTDTAIDATETDYLHILLPPGEFFNPPIRAVISSANDNTIMFGTKIDNAVPDSNMYTVSGTSVNAGEGGDHVINSTTATNLWLPEGDWTDADDGPHLLFRTGDLIRVNDEIMELTAVGSGVDGTANNYLTVIRGVHGSTAATHTAGNPIRFPFFNAHHDFEKYTVAQSNSDGKFKCFNFMGQARSETISQGLIPGSLAIKFYDPGSQSLGLSGISSVTHSGLVGSRLYGMNITVDGGSLFTDLSFTTDTTDLTFGKVIELIQSAFNVQFYTAGNLFEKQVYVGIENGDVVFRSASHLSDSAISLAAPTGAASEYNPFGVGRFPAIGNIDKALPAKLPDDVTYDSVTYEQIQNSSAFGYDDGNANIIGKCRGKISYETGSLDITSAPKNAQFVVSALTKSAFSGKLNESEDDRINSLVDIRANTPSQKWSGSVKVRTW